MDTRPIGVFDSGLGGLTVVKELRRLLPNEDIVYFGDTGRVPYGTKSRETVTRYALQDIEFLRGKNVKMVVIACNTVSAVLPAEITEKFDFPYVSVLIPAVNAAVKRTRNGKIGVICTSATAKSGAYETSIRKIIPDIAVITKACPLFVPLVESGWFQKDNKVAALVAEEYLSPLRALSIDTCILGCTHYPYLHDIIDSTFEHKVALIDSGRETAAVVKSVLEQKELLSDSESEGKCGFFVSDSVETFTELAGKFLLTDIQGDVAKVSL